jgi:3-oxoacyl-[acyl-carrier protein] reductase
LAANWQSFWGECRYDAADPPHRKTRHQVSDSARAALIHYSKGLSNQLIAKGIRVNVVSPGNTYFEGGIWQNIERKNPDLFNAAMSLNPTAHMGTAEEVAAGVVFLASAAASRISGTNLIIDGALTKAV